MQGIVLLLNPYFITSNPIMSLILYILSEYVWEKPNNKKPGETSTAFYRLLFK
jgi:hypothetical protein